MSVPADGQRGSLLVKVQDIIDRLSVLGLDADEAAVYVHLSIMGPSKASDIAAALKMHRTETYRTLQNLVQRGFATATLSRPARFEAAAPERLFQEILAAQLARQESIQRAQTEISGALSSLRGATGQPLSKNTFKILQGRREIYAVLERMLREAHAEVKAVSTHAGALQMGDMAGLLDVGAQRAREGLRLRAVLHIDDASRQRLAALQTPRMEFRHVEEARVARFAIADDRELLLWVVSDPSSRLAAAGDVALWTDAADFVGTQSLLFESLWREASRLEDLPPAEAASVGAPPRTP
jgi:sugar-specific transcriptional regulator TrmB